MGRHTRLRFPVFARRLVLVVVAAVAATCSTTQGDTWWALRAGRDIWRHHTVSLVDRYSYTAYGDSWPDHEWLWQLLAYLLHAIGGLPLLTLAVGLLAAATVALSTAGQRARRIDVVLIVLAVPGLIGGWAVRPQMASMLCLALLLWLLRTGRWWWAPPLMLVWANLHGGVVFGGLALAAGCVAAAFSWRTERRRLLVLVGVTAAGAVATLLTPLGSGLWHYVLTSGSRPFEDRIVEWQPVYHQLSFYTVAFWLWVAGTAVVVVVRRRRLRDWEARLGLAVTVATLPLAVDALRNMPMFVVAALPLLAHLLRGERPRERPRDTVPRGRGMLTAAGAVAALVVAGIYAAPPADLGWTPMSRTAAAAIERCPGHVYTSYDSGAYLIWFTPRVRVFADNRQDPYSERILDLSTLDAQSVYQSTFARYGVECAALLADQQTARERLATDGWQVAYRDDRWVVLTAPGFSLAHALASGA